MRSSLRALLVSLALLTVLTGLVYPMLILGLAQMLFPEQANGSLQHRGGKIVGSTLIGQQFDDTRYFWGRPSATQPTSYNAAGSGASNLAPSNPQLAKELALRCATLVAANGGPQAPIPIDLVTASGSGLDPDISVTGAYFQAARIARVRKLPVAQVNALIAAHEQRRLFGLIGERRVNVLEINLALDGSQ